MMQKNNPMTPTSFVKNDGEGVKFLPKKHKEHDYKTYKR